MHRPNQTQLDRGNDTTTDSTFADLGRIKAESCTEEERSDIQLALPQHLFWPPFHFRI